MFSLTLQAQKKIVQEEIKYQQEPVELNLDFASSIALDTWEKSSILVEATVETVNKKYTDLFKLEVERSGPGLEIGSNSGDIFEAYQEDHPDRYVGPEHEISYKVYVPEGIELDLSSITGNVTSEYLSGDIVIDLVSGNIDIKDFKGDLRLETVSGKIKLPVKETSFTAETLMGDIHSETDLNLEKGLVGQKIKLDYEGSSNRLSLNTVTGDIHLE